MRRPGTAVAPMLAMAWCMLWCVAWCAPLRANRDIVHARQVRLRHLAGTVVDPRGFPVAYALVELRGGGGAVLATTFADAEGKFSFADRKRGEEFELRASLKGFDTARYPVVEAILGKERLKIVLPPAN